MLYLLDIVLKLVNFGLRAYLGFRTLLFTGLVASFLAIEELLNLLVLEVEDRVCRQADIFPVRVFVQPLKSL